MTRAQRAERAAEIAELAWYAAARPQTPADFQWVLDRAQQAARYARLRVLTT